MTKTISGETGEQAMSTILDTDYQGKILSTRGLAMRFPYDRLKIYVKTTITYRSYV